jgi:NADH:ubiquinone oxidoreductase subunit 5 (subunit L)/multisubunit Na+/H+ antiporter MnhA subunit
MPLTALLMLGGALSISAIVPFNGFASEWLTLQSIFTLIIPGEAMIDITAILAVAALALAGALAAALYIASGVRGMERGTLSEQRDENGNETFANMELLRLAMPRRVFTLSQVNYAVDRICWLYENRKLIEGLRFVEEPKILRFFFGRLEPISNWQRVLLEKFKEDFGDSL